MKKLLSLIVALLTFQSGVARAQFDTSGINAALTKLFGETTAFSARATVQVYDKNQKEKLITPIAFAFLDGKMRIEVDASQIRSGGAPPAGMAQLKELKLDIATSIIRPDKKARYFIFPRHQAFVNQDMTPEEVAPFQTKPKVTKQELGKETVDGHPCIKSRVVIASDGGKNEEATVWYATDLKNFPIQIMTREKEDTVVVRFREVQLAKPDIRTFDPPAGYKQFLDMQIFLASLLPQEAPRTTNSTKPPAKQSAPAPKTTKKK